MSQNQQLMRLFILSKETEGFKAISKNNLSLSAAPIFCHFAAMIKTGNR